MLSKKALEPIMTTGIWILLIAESAALACATSFDANIEPQVNTAHGFVLSQTTVIASNDSTTDQTAALFTMTPTPSNETTLSINDRTAPAIPSAADLARVSISIQNTLHTLTSLNDVQWDHYLLAAPLSVAFIGHIMGLSYQQDVPFNDVGRFKALRSSNGLRLAMLEINGEAVNAFSKADTNMMRLKMQSTAIQDFVATGIDDMREQRQNPALLIMMLKINFGLIQSAATKCAKYANDTSNAFGLVHDMIEDVIQATGVSEAQRRSLVLRMQQKQNDSRVREQQLKAEREQLLNDMNAAKALAAQMAAKAAEHRENMAQKRAFTEIKESVEQCSSMSFDIGLLSWIFGKGGYSSCEQIPVTKTVPLPIESVTVYVMRRKSGHRKLDPAVFQTQMIAYGLVKAVQGLTDSFERLRSEPGTQLNESAVERGTLLGVKLVLNQAIIQVSGQFPGLQKLAELYPAAGSVLEGANDVVNALVKTKDTLDGQGNFSSILESLEELADQLRSEVRQSFQDPADRFAMGQTLSPDITESTVEGEFITVTGTHAAIQAQAVSAEVEAANAKMQFAEAQAKLARNVAQLNQLALAQAQAAVQTIDASKIIELAQNASVYLTFLQASWKAMAKFFDRISSYVDQLRENALAKANAYVNCGTTGSDSTTSASELRTCHQLIAAKIREIEGIYRTQIFPNANVLKVASSLYLKASLSHILLPMSSVIGVLNIRSQADVAEGITRIWANFQQSLAKIEGFVAAQHGRFAETLAAVDAKAQATERKLLENVSREDETKLKNMAAEVYSMERPEVPVVDIDGFERIPYRLI